MFLYNMYNQVLQLILCTLGEFFLLIFFSNSSLSGVVMQLLSYFGLYPYTELILMKQSCAVYSSISWVRKDTLYGHSCDLVKMF